MGRGKLAGGQVSGLTWTMATTVLLPLTLSLLLCNGSFAFFLQPCTPPCSSRNQCSSSPSKTSLLMGDHSSATLFQVGDTVQVNDDVLKAGKNLKGLKGTVIETWEKCDVDPTCCCAEWVDEGLSVHVRFEVEVVQNQNPSQVDHVDGEPSVSLLLANDVFVHYFAESELIKTKKEEERTIKESTVAFDGLSCMAFKLDKLKMGGQAQRIAAFEKSRDGDMEE